MREKIEAKLAQIKYPGFEKDLISYGFLKEIKQDGDKYIITLDIPSAKKEISSKLEASVNEALKGFDFELKILQPSMPKEQGSKNIAPQIERFVMVSSGKGGVGKSTTTLNLALSMAKMGKKVGLLDADVYGPNIPRMLGIEEVRPDIVGNKINPIQSHGLYVMSMGLLIEQGQGLMWRGAMIMKTIEQLLSDVAWPKLDILFIDMPPGTGDAQISLAQSVPITAGICVSTPQVVALDDSKRSLDMFAKLHIPVAGVIENMSGFLCPDNGIEYPIFGKGTTEAVAKEYGTTILAQIPLELSIREGGDDGKPIAFYNNQSLAAKRYEEAAILLAKFMDEMGSNSNANIQPH